MLNSFSQELTQDKLDHFGGSGGNGVATSVRSQVGSRKSKAPSVTSSNPRILVGDERTKFVTTVMNSTFRPEIVDRETEHISEKVRSKVSKLVEQQSNASHLQKQCLPAIPKSYAGPVIQNHIENVRDNCFVVTNDAHIRSTNPGFSRKQDSGGFYYH